MKYKVLSVIMACMIIILLLPTVSAAQPKLVALTFDDGPGPYTERLLDGLAEKGVHATFFCLGSRAENDPEIIRRMVSEGHQVANHSYSHPNLNDLHIDTALHQILATDQILNNITGGEESYAIRPPYGNTTQTLRSKLSAPVIIWSVDTIDWQLLNSQAVEKKILFDTFDGSIVLMHDIHASTIGAVLSAVDTLKARGYEFVTVKELMRCRNVDAVNGQQYYRCDPSGNDQARLNMPEMMVEREGEMLEISLTSPDGAPIYYTTDGSDILYSATLYEGPFSVSLPCTIRAVSAWDLNGDRSAELTHTYSIPPAGEPDVDVSNGKLIFTVRDHEETVYVKADDWLDYLPADEADVHLDTWFSYYADGEGLAASAVNRLLFTKNGNITADLEQTDWYYTAMDHCISSEYFKGTGNRVYDPSGVLTRGMLISLLFRYDGADYTVTDHPFTDVTETDYYAAAVSWGYRMGIVAGIGEGKFAANRCVSRQELAKMIALYLNLDRFDNPSAYVDQGDIAVWAVPYVAAVTEAGLMSGGGGYFRPTDFVTRAEAAAILMRMDEMNIH